MSGDEVIGVIDRAPAVQVRIALTTWKGERRLELKEATAVTSGIYCDLVIRQRARWDEEDDVCIVIAQGNLEAVIAEMRAIGEPAQVGHELPLLNGETASRGRGCAAMISTFVTPALIDMAR
jgi:hypothetical protein